MPDASSDALAKRTPEYAPERILALASAAARVLFVNGQTTEGTVAAAGRIARRFGCEATVLPHWEGLVIRLSDSRATYQEVVPVAPLGVDMQKVAAVNGAIDGLDARRIEPAAAGQAIAAAARMAPTPLWRFALLAGAGAAALAVLFGTTDALSLALIALSAGAGACLRRWIAGHSRNSFVQPLCAALLAGGVGAAATHFRVDPSNQLIAVCPCMVLVPGPHFLNGTLDLARARIALGSARLMYAALVIVMICTGLLLGLRLGGVGLPASGASNDVPLAADVIAAGVAVAAYGTFFAMPWRTLPIPMAIGMAAHALRWFVITAGHTGSVTGAFVACLVVGTVVTPVAVRLHLPFASIGFASVVSLLPGIFLFRMASGVEALVALGAKAPANLLAQTVTDGITALLTILAMAFGLILPKMGIEAAWPGLSAQPRPAMAAHPAGF